MDSWHFFQGYCTPFSRKNCAKVVGPLVTDLLLMSNFVAARPLLKWHFYHLSLQQLIPYFDIDF
jgi:hypothetical protein